MDVDLALLLSSVPTEWGSRTLPMLISSIDIQVCWSDLPLCLVLVYVMLYNYSRTSMARTPLGL